MTKDEAKLDYFSIKPVYLNELNRNIVLNQGEHLNLLCRLNESCEPKPSVLWFRDGRLINEESGYSTFYIPMTGECRLTAEYCDKSIHEGIYTCAAAIPELVDDSIITKTSTKVKIISIDEINTEDSASEIELNRGIAPIFLQTLQDVTLEEGDDLELKCQIMGAPLPEVACYFTKDMEEKGIVRKIKSNLVQYNYETGICRVNLNGIKQTNDGYYIIKASNDAGVLTSSCRVRVKSKSVPNLNLNYECEPSFTIPLEPEFRGMDGQEINMICVCSALPEPEIIWYRSTLENIDEFTPVKLTNDIKVMFDVSSGKCTLKINDAYPQDSGVYVCVASNFLGTAETRTTLIVEGKN